MNKNKIIKSSLSRTPYVFQAASQFTEFILKGVKIKKYTSLLCLLESSIFLLHIVERQADVELEKEEKNIFVENLVVDTKESIVKLAATTPIDQEKIRLEFFKLYNKRAKEYYSYEIRRPGDNPKGELFSEFGKIISFIFSDYGDVIIRIKAAGYISIILKHYPILPEVNIINNS